MYDESATSGRFGALIDLIDEDRSRLAHRLHDRVAQNLAALAMNLEMTRPSAGDPAAIRRADECQVLLDECIREVRAISYSLQIPLASEVGLPTSLKTLADVLAAESGTQLDVEVDEHAATAVSSSECQLIVQIVTDCVRALGPAVVRIQARVLSDDGKVTILVSGPPGPASAGMRENVHWAVVEQRAAGHLGKARIVTGGSAAEMEVTLPLGESTK